MTDKPDVLRWSLIESVINSVINSRQIIVRLHLERLIEIVDEVTAERDAALAQVAELRIGVALVEVDLLSGSISPKQRVALAADRVRALLGGTK
jgi:hypothetical protein